LAAFDGARLTTPPSTRVAAKQLQLARRLAAPQRRWACFTTAVRTPVPARQPSATRPRTTCGSLLSCFLADALDFVSRIPQTDERPRAKALVRGPARLAALEVASVAASEQFATAPTALRKHLGMALAATARQGVAVISRAHQLLDEGAWQVCDVQAARELEAMLRKLLARVALLRSECAITGTVRDMLSVTRAPADVARDATLERGVA